MVRVALIDSGWSGEDLSGRVELGVTVRHTRAGLCTQADGAPDIDGHGTRCGNLILEQCPSAALLPIRILDSELRCTPAQLIAALRIAVRARCSIVNVSLGMRVAAAVAPLYHACAEAARKGTVVVAAADNVGVYSFPAVFDNVIGVLGGAFQNASWHLMRDDAIECIAHGYVHDTIGVTAPRASYAAARVAGRLAVQRALGGAQSVEDARAWLSAAGLRRHDLEGQPARARDACEP